MYVKKLWMQCKDKVFSGIDGWSAALLISCLVTFFFVYLRPVTSQDFWFHAAAGADIEQTHTLPHTIAYAFGAVKNNVFIVHSWLGSRLIYLGMSAWGYHGMIILKALLFACLFGLAALWVYLESRIGFFALLALALLVIGFMGRYALRPELFAFLFFMVHIGCMRLFSQSAQYRYVFIALGLFPLWVNTHPSFWVGLYIILAFALHDIFSRTNGSVVSALGSALLPWGCIIAAFVAASFINPYGPMLHQHTLSAIFFSSGIQGFALEWKPFYSSYYAGSLVQLLNTILFMVIGLLWWHKRYEMPLWGHFLCIPFYLLALSSQRFTAFLVLAVLLPFAHCYAACFDATKTRFYMQIGAVIVLSMLLFGIIKEAQSDHRVFSLSYRGDFSEKAIEKIFQLDIKGPVWNYAGYGGQILYFFAPRLEVFIDGRLDAYGGDHIRFYKQFYHQSWHKIYGFFKDHGVHVAVLPPDAIITLKTLRIYEAFLKHGWCVVYQDQTTVILSDNLTCESV